MTRERPLSLKALVRHAFPLSAKSSTVSKQAEAASEKAPIVSKKAKVVNCNLKRPFVRNYFCSQFWESLFAILAECSQFCFRASQWKNKRKSITLLFWEG